MDEQIKDLRLPYKKHVILFCILAFVVWPIISIFVILFEQSNSLATNVAVTVSLQLVFSMIGLFFTLFQVNWKVEIFSSEFIYTNLFRKKGKYNFAEIKVKMRNGSYRIYKGDKRVLLISFLVENHELFSNAVKEYSKKAKN
ncbi:MAG: hypothetical protein FWE16_03100 [Firmicutes bacterium]|nr:hypothetical protein [Bacillota bacterium]